MRFRPCIFILAASLLPFLLASCSGQGAVKPSPTFPAVTLQSALTYKTKPAAPTSIPETTLALTQLPPQSTPTPSAGAINPENVSLLNEVIRWGKGTILYMASSADGRLYALATRRGLAIYDAASFQELRFVEVPGGFPLVAFSTDWQTIAAADWNAKIRLYRVTDGVLLKTLDGGDIGQPLSLVFSGDGKTLSMGTSAELTLLWDVEAGKLAHRWITSGASAMAASSDGMFLASSNYQGFISIFNAADGRSLGRLWRDSDVECLHFSPDSLTLAACYGDNTLALWDSMDGKLLFTLHGHTDRVVDTAFSPDGKLVVSASRDQTVRLWDASTGQLIYSLSDTGGRLKQIIFNGDGKTFVSLAEDGILRVWNTQDGSLLKKISDFAPLGGAVFSPNGKLVATGGEDGTWRLWNAATGLLINSAVAHPGGISDLAFSPDGSRLVTGGMDNKIRLWNAADGAPQTVLNGSESWINSLAVSPDGKMAAGSTSNGTVRMWSLADGRLLYTIDTGLETVLKVIFAPDGESLWTGAMDGSLKQWNSRDGSIIATYIDSGPFISSIAFDADGKWLAAAGDDRRINLWQINGSTLFRIIDGIKNVGVSSLAFSPDGTLVFAGYWDKSLRIFSAAEAKLIKQFDLPFVVRKISLAPDATLLALSLDDGTVRLWGIESSNK